MCKYFVNTISLCIYMQGILATDYIIEITIKPWDPSDTRNADVACGTLVNIHPFHADEEGTVYFRTQASLRQVCNAQEGGGSWRQKQLISPNFAMFPHNTWGAKDIKNALLHIPYFMQVPNSAIQLFFIKWQKYRIANVELLS